jgi:hypothetical protein
MSDRVPSQSAISGWLIPFSGGRRNVRACGSAGNLHKAQQIDPMLKPAYQKLAEIYLEDHERAKVRETFEQYLKTF